MNRILTLLLVTVTASLALVAAAAAQPKLLENTPLEGVPVANQVVRGVAGGGLPWVTGDGSMAKVTVDGELKVVVHNLFFAPGTPFAGTRGTVEVVKATVVCADGSLVDSATVPLSLDGNAIVRETVQLPAGCTDPIVMVRSAGGRWFARTAG
jgi:hypothetical protein